MLAVNATAPLQRHLQKVKAQYEEDLESGLGGVHLPHALERKYPNAEREWAWQWVFPSSRLSVDPRSVSINDGVRLKRRHHVEESALQLAVKKAVIASGIEKPATCHTFRHSFRPICWRTDMISAPCKSCSAIRTSRPR